METYSTSFSSSSALQETRGTLKLISQQPFHGSLHSVRKQLAKPWKKSIAPLPPTPLKVYRVDPINFRDLVQKLTGAPELMSQSHQTSSSQLQLPHQRLQRVAPSPLKIVAAASQSQKFSDNAMVTSNSSPGLNSSPSSYNWCDFPILSPGTLSSLDRSTVP